MKPARLSVRFSAEAISRNILTRSISGHDPGEAAIALVLSPPALQIGEIRRV
jgi:hypothetical protein